jgi:hypothetical protein
MLGSKDGARSRVDVERLLLRIFVANRWADAHTSILMPSTVAGSNVR